ncbi:hypothetical protein [Streptomyces sp. ME19-01-6]|uniref:hypothetical protein n=1 Tax=Streptomyces sp. ME19-01-6 TaxID=3028686 RepID=UPI0029B8761F|nr:hypothetical protein [Streptomyces sp. ME19-01-6]MDX3226684.1 hypothetical protein [Streptomyces sp. ME19-01-6]
MFFALGWHFTKSDASSPPRLPEQPDIRISGHPDAVSADIEGTPKKSALNLTIDYGSTPRPLNWWVSASTRGLGSPCAKPDGAKVAYAGPHGVPTVEPWATVIISGTIPEDYSWPISIRFCWQNSGSNEWRQGPIVKSGPYLAVALPGINTESRKDLEVNESLRMKDLRKYMIQVGQSPTRITSVGIMRGGVGAEEVDKWIWEESGRNLPPVSLAVNLAETQKEAASEAFSLTFLSAFFAALVTFLVEFCAIFVKDAENSDAITAEGHDGRSG